MKRSLCLILGHKLPTPVSPSWGTHTVHCSRCGEPITLAPRSFRDRIEGKK